MAVFRPKYHLIPFFPNPNAKLLHYTLGAPCFHDFATTPMANEWHRERIYTEYCQQHNI